MLLAYIICVRDVIRSGIIKPLYIVHHKDYINESNYIDDNVFFNWDNLEGLCLDCHNKEHFKKKIEYKFDENGDLICNG